MRIYVEAFGHDGRQILGNLDGQRAWQGSAYRRTAWYRALPTLRTLDDRVAFYRIVAENGRLLERVAATTRGECE